MSNAVIELVNCSHIRWELARSKPSTLYHLRYRASCWHALTSG